MGLPFGYLQGATCLWCKPAHPAPSLLWHLQKVSLCEPHPGRYSPFSWVSRKSHVHRHPHSLPLGNSLSIWPPLSSCGEVQRSCKGQKNPGKGTLGLRKLGCRLSVGSERSLDWPSSLGELSPSGGKYIMGFCSTGGADRVTRVSPCCSLLLPENSFVSTKIKWELCSK